MTLGEYNAVGQDDGVDGVIDVLSDFTNQHLHFRRLINLPQHGFVRPFLGNRWQGAFVFHSARTPYGMSDGTYYFNHNTHVKGANVLMTRDYLDVHGQDILNALSTILAGPFIDNKPCL